MNIYIFEDQLVSNFHPITYTHPVFDIKAGIGSILSKTLDHFSNDEIILIVRPYLAEVTKLHYPDFSVNPDDIEEGLWVNGRMLFRKEDIASATKSKGRLFYNNNCLALAHLSEQDANEWIKRGGPPEVDLKLNTPKSEISPKVFNYIWDVVQSAGDLLTVDFNLMYGKGEIAGEIYPNVSILDKERVFIAKNAIVKPGVVLDAEEGPIVIDEGAVIMPNAVIEGPTYIGKMSLIKAGARIYGKTHIGAVCKIGGEVNESIIHGYSNKQHEGYLGNAYLGEWINIGADSNNSDLKNTYSTVKVLINGKIVDTGSLYVGLIMGDHTKTGINTMFNTGTIAGAGCNIFGTDYPPKYIPSFSWGGVGGFQEHRLSKMFETAEVAMRRRNVNLTQIEKNLLTHVFEKTKSERNW